MTSNKKDIILSDYNDNNIYLRVKLNILYDIEKQEIMKEYNQSLLNI